MNQIIKTVNALTSNRFNEKVNLQIFKFSNLFALCSLFFTLQSCGDFLNQAPFSEITEAQFDKNTNYVNLLLTGCYNGLQGALHAEWAMTELRSDNARIYARTSATATFNNIFLLDTGSPNSLDEFITEYWTANYKNIARCNNMIVESKYVTDETLKNRMAAEARFIRAYHYFNLVRLYGPVFLVTEPTTYEDVDYSRFKDRSPVEEALGFIQGELKSVVDTEALPNSYGDTDLGRVTALAAKTLLAKVYMHRYAPGTTEYALAIPLLKQVIVDAGNPQSAASLVPYSAIFSTTNEMNAEILFAVRYLSGNKGLGSSFANEYAPANSGLAVINGQGKSYNYPSNSILAAYEPGDLRKDVSMAEGYTKVNGEYISDDGNGTTAMSRYVKKFLSQVTTVNDAENDFPVIRLADAILLYCEAVNEVTGVTAEILNYYNMIRERAGLTAKTSAEITNSYTFRDAIRKERRVELAFENQRWFDLLRWRNTDSFINDSFAQEGIYAAAGYTPRFTPEKLLLPIPSIVFDINPSIPQNLGY